ARGVGQRDRGIEAEHLVERVLGHPQIAEPERVGALGDAADGRLVDRLDGAVRQRHAVWNSALERHAILPGCAPSSRPRMMAATREAAMDVVAMLREFCDAVEKRDGARFAALFRADGVYHDVFYGAFAGRQKIAAMIDDWFHRTAADFRWDMHEPVC